MQTEQGNVLASLRNVKKFLEENASKLDAVVKTSHPQKLDDAILALSSHTAQQSGSTLAAQGATQKQRQLRAVLLRDHMRPIARIARLELPETPELAPLRMPDGRPSAERLLSAVQGMAETATAHAAVFTGAGLPADFVTQLTTVADAMIATKQVHAQSQGKRRGATTGLKGTLSNARRVVHVIDAFVTTALQDDPALLDNWNGVKRVQRTGVRTTVVTPTQAPSVLLSTTTPANVAA